MNLSKRAEDWLYQRQEQLESLSLQSSEEYKQLDDEINRRADMFNLKSQAAKNAEEEKKRVYEAAVAEYEAVIAEHGQRVTMKAMSLEFGESIRENYYIDNIYTVHSLAKTLDDKSSNTWPFETLEDAKNKVEVLIYYNVYNKYFRDGADNETLIRLKRKIVEIKLNGED